MTAWNNRPTPTVSILGHQPTTEGASVRTLDEWHRVIAPGVTVELHGGRYTAGQTITLTEAQARELDAQQALLPFGKVPQPVVQVMVGRIEEADIPTQLRSRAERDGRRR